MHIIIAIALGIIQGLTEFLPVSSSGHLLLFQSIFGVEDAPLFFSVMLHIGTLAAVCAVLYKDIWQLIKHPFSRPTLMLLLATACTVVIAIPFKLFIPEIFEGAYLGFGFMITGVVLYIMDFFPSGSRTLEQITWKDALTMGISQGFGTFPGISRSGITIAGGSLTGLSRDALARFSFLLSIPAILGSFVLEFKDLDFAALAAGNAGVGWLEILIGTVVAAVVGFLAVKWLMKLIIKKSLRPFSYYVFILGFLVVLDCTVTHLVF